VRRIHRQHFQPLLCTDGSEAAKLPWEGYRYTMLGQGSTAPPVWPETVKPILFSDYDGIFCTKIHDNWLSSPIPHGGGEPRRQ